MAQATEKKVKWSFEADYYQACNCDYGCPCEFEAPPTQGFCDGVGVWSIAKGRYGDIPLDGLAVAFAAHWPGPLHKGGGTACLFFDERANAKQRDALMSIVTGKAGGLPFEIIVTTLAKVLEPRYVKFEISKDGRWSQARVGEAVAMAFEPIKNPVTGADEGVKIIHETGFMFKDAEVVSAKECRASLEGLKFSHPGKAGFVTRVRYGN